MLRVTCFRPPLFRSMSRKQKRKDIKQEPAATPQEIVLRRSKVLLPEDDYQALLAELDQPLRSAIRINSLKVEGTASQMIERLTLKHGWSLEPIPYCDHGWWVEGDTQNIGQTWEHRLGMYYVQDASSMLPVELFDFSADTLPHPLILDMAASPGGKTTHIISKTGDSGFVLANDASQERITALRLILQTWGSVNHAITQFPGEKFGQWFPETFDAVLLDAPCSMQNLRSTEARPMRTITAREEQSLALRQKKLLESALLSARVGGQIVYATCTLMPEEDEQVVDWLLKKYSNAVKVEDRQYQLPQPAPALPNDEWNVFEPDVQKAIRVWPHRFRSSGFFCVRLTKTGTTSGKRSDPPRFDISRTDFSPLDIKFRQDLSAFFKSRFQVDLQAVLDAQNLSLWIMKQQIIAFPQRYFDVFTDLPLRSIGLPVASFNGEVWQPDHHWVSRFFSQFKAASVELPEEFMQPWGRGEDIPLRISGVESGQILIFRSTDHLFMGMGRQTMDGIKNLLPKRMVL